MSQALRYSLSRASLGTSRRCLCRCSASAGSDFGASARKAAQQFVATTGERLGQMAAEATETFNTKVEEIDRKYAIGRRSRNLLADAQRRWPYVRLQLDDFFSRPLGKILLWTLLLLSLTSGLFFRVLNLLFVLWWLPVLFMPLISAARRQQTQKAQEAAARAQQQQQAWTRSPFSAWTRGGFGGAGAAGSGGRGASRGWQDDGPVIEAEWTTIDEPDQPRSRRSR